MKKIFLLLILITSFTLLLESNQTDVKIPLRIFSDNKFVDNQTIQDIKIFENGKEQSIDALYLVRNNLVVRKEEIKKKKLKLERNFILLFSTRHYDAKIDEAIDYFFNNVILPGDSLSIFTPRKSYKMKPIALRKKPKKVIAKQLKGLLRRDTLNGNQKYLSIIDDLTEMVEDLTTGVGEFSLEVSLPRYIDILSGLEVIRTNQQRDMLEFAKSFKSKKGQKFLFFFYDREFKPDFTPTQIQSFKLQYKERPDVIHQISSLFELYRRDVTFNLKNLGKEFADSSILVNSIFFKGKFKRAARVPMREYSEDIFEIFTYLSDITGGTTKSSSNLFSSFKDAVKHSNTHYLICYTSSLTKENKKFKTIKIKTGNKNYKVFYRKGYF